MKAFILTVFTLAALSAPAFAEGEGEANREKGPCIADIKKLCGDVKPGGGAIAKCLREKKDQVSAECKAFHEQKKGEMKEKFSQAKEACAADREKFCKDVKPGGGAIIKCLKAHEAELSEACKASRPQRKHKD